MEWKVHRIYNSATDAMIKKKDIINMARHIAKRSSGRKDHRLMHPLRDWLIGLFTVVTLLLVGQVYTGFLLLQKQSEDIDSYTVQVETTSYKRERIDAALTTYREKQESFDSVRAEWALVQPVVPEEEGSEEGVDPDEVDDEDGEEEDASQVSPDFEIN